MQINLTFFIQILNVLITIWMLRSILWPELLATIEAENVSTAQNIQACNDARLAIQTVAQEQEEKKISLAHDIQATIKTGELLEQETPAALEKSCIQIPETPVSTSACKVSAQKITALLQKKFQP